MAKDQISSVVMRILSVFAGILILLIIAGLLYKSYPILQQESLSHLLFSDKWFPLRGEFGFLPFILGTFWVTVIASVMAIPVSLLAAIYLSEYAHSHVKRILKPIIDLLSGIPSVIFGVCGVVVIVPFIRDFVAPVFGESISGYCLLSGGIVLSVMIMPIMIHLSSEILKSVPVELREASLSLGATKWETIIHVVLRKSLPGIITAVVLGFARALGETLAVMMVVGNVVQIPDSIFDPAYPLPSLIANNYGEMMSIPMYDSALMLASLILLLIVLFFNIGAQTLIRYTVKRTA